MSFGIAAASNLASSYGIMDANLDRDVCYICICVLFAAIHSYFSAEMFWVSVDLDVLRIKACKTSQNSVHLEMFEKPSTDRDQIMVRNRIASAH